MRRLAWGLAVLMMACGVAAPPTGLAQSSLAPRQVDFGDAVAFAGRAVELARAGDLRALGAAVDWPWVRRLAAMSGAFSPTLQDLVATLTTPGTDPCGWETDEGGHRLDFPPAMVDDSEEVAAEKDALKAGLYAGEDVVRLCPGVGGERGELFMMQLVRGAGGEWQIRGWARLGGQR